jgi:protein-disulfide isomerase
MRFPLPGLQNLLFALACAVVILLGSVRLYDRFRSGASSVKTLPNGVEAVSDVRIDIGAASIKAKGSPRIVLIEFSDFQCPYCGRYARDIYPRVQKEFVDTGQVSYAFLNFPLERIHPRAVKAAESVECAGRQGKFWEMHDELFRNQLALADTDLANYAQKVGLSLPDFQACIETGVMPRILQHIDLAGMAGVSSTPTFLVGQVESGTIIRATHRILGAQPFDVISQVLRNAIEKQ